MKTCKDVNITICFYCKYHGGETCMFAYYTMLLNSNENIKEHIIDIKKYITNVDNNIYDDAFYLKKAAEICHPELVDMVNKLLILM